MTRASEWSCPFTGLRAGQLHHPTGKLDGAYLDPKFVIPLVRRQHSLEHSCWRAAGICEDVHLQPNVLRLRRSGHLLVRLARHRVGGVVELPDFTALELGLLLLRVADECERGE